MYAIVETGGKQYRMRPGDVLDVERLPGESDSEIEFDRVLAVKEGDTLKVGTPILEGTRVRARVLGHRRDRKVVVFKYKPRKGYRRRRGHRQWLTRVRIEEILEND